MSAPGLYPALPIALTDHLEWMLVVLSTGAKPPSSPTAVLAATLRRPLELVVHLRAHPHRLRNEVAPSGAIMYSCKSTGVRVHPAVHDVHRRDGEHARVRPPRSASTARPPRRTPPAPSPVRRRESRSRRAELAVGAVESDHGLVESALVVGIESGDGCRDLAVHVFNRTPYTLAAKGRPAIAQLQRLPRSSGRARRRRSTAPRPRSEADIDLGEIELPQLSRIWRAWTCSIALIVPPGW